MGLANRDHERQRRRRAEGQVKDLERQRERQTKITQGKEHRESGEQNEGLLRRYTCEVYIVEKQRTGSR